MIGHEGLLRLVVVVERLRRQQAEVTVRAEAGDDAAGAGWVGGSACAEPGFGGASADRDDPQVPDVYG
ncbi:hypothetical protein ACW2Q0_17075 [Nocardia sp. R16R-3T]